MRRSAPPKWSACACVMRMRAGASPGSARLVAVEAGLVVTVAAADDVAELEAAAVDEDDVEELEAAAGAAVDVDVEGLEVEAAGSGDSRRALHMRLPSLLNPPSTTICFSIACMKSSRSHSPPIPQAAVQKITLFFNGNDSVDTPEHVCHPSAPGAGLRSAIFRQNGEISKWLQGPSHLCFSIAAGRCHPHCPPRPPGISIVDMQGASLVQV